MISKGLQNKNRESTQAPSAGRGRTDANKSVPGSDTIGATEFVIHREYVQSVRVQVTSQILPYSRITRKWHTQWSHQLRGKFKKPIQQFKRESMPPQQKKNWENFRQHINPRAMGFYSQSTSIQLHWSNNNQDTMARSRDNRSQLNTATSMALIAKENVDW